uniref:Rho-GAP domain-containing protein n=1 Tax=Chelonoidis abingdonii TaxID=106734 RepID=A0A8C0JFJ5_CHEAB
MDSSGGQRVWGAGKGDRRGCGRGRGEREKTEGLGDYYCPQAFGIPLSQVIANDWTHKQMQEAVKGSRRDCLEVEATVAKFRAQIQKKSPFVGGCMLGLSGEFADEPLSPTFLHTVSRSHRRGGVSVDSITDLSDNTSRLLEALQLSHPNELDLRRTLERNKTLSLNPICRQVPRVVDRCCQHIEAFGLQTVGIFRVGSSKKRVQQVECPTHRTICIGDKYHRDLEGEWEMGT